MKFFQTVRKAMQYAGMIFFLFLFSTIITSFVYYQHRVDRLDDLRNVEIFQSEEVLSFRCYGDRQLNIEVEYREEKSPAYVMMVAYYYFDRYAEPVQLFDFTDGFLLTVDSNGILVLSVYEKENVDKTHFLSIER